jgi:hypothetical protein
LSKLLQPIAQEQYHSDLFSPELLQTHNLTITSHPQVSLEIAKGFANHPDELMRVVG